MPSDLAESVAGAGAALGLVVSDGEQGWGSSHCSLPVGKVAMALQGRMLCLGEGSRLGQGVLADGEMGLDSCVTFTGQPWLRGQLTGTLSPGRIP